MRTRLRAQSHWAEDATEPRTQALAGRRPTLLRLHPCLASEGRDESPVRQGATAVCHAHNAASVQCNGKALSGILLLS